MPYKDIEKQKAAQKAYYEKNKEKVKQVARDRRNLVVRYVQQYKQERGCTDCKIMYPYWILELDHLPEFTKIGNVATMVATHSFEDVKAELAKCEVVCANCHKDRTRNRLISSGESILFLD